DVGAEAVELGQGVGPGRGDRDVEALLAEHVGESIAVALLILDDENAGHGRASCGGTDGMRAGKERVNDEPCPSSDHTVTSPPWEATTCLTIDNPRPVPPVERWRAGSTR